MNLPDIILLADYKASHGKPNEDREAALDAAAIDIAELNARRLQHEVTKIITDRIWR